MARPLRFNLLKCRPWLGWAPSSGSAPKLGLAELRLGASRARASPGHARNGIYHLEIQDAGSVIGVNDDFLKPLPQAIANRLRCQQEDEFAHFFITPLVCHCPPLSWSEAGALAVRLACGSVHAAAPLLGPDARPGPCE